MQSLLSPSVAVEFVNGKFVSDDIVFLMNEHKARRGPSNVAFTLAIEGEGHLYVVPIFPLYSVRWTTLPMETVLSPGMRAVEVGQREPSTKLSYLPSDVEVAPPATIFEMRYLENDPITVLALVGEARRGRAGVMYTLPDLPDKSKWNFGDLLYIERLHGFRPFAMKADDGVVHVLVGSAKSVKALSKRAHPGLKDDEFIFAGRTLAQPEQFTKNWMFPGTEVKYPDDYGAAAGFVSESEPMLRFYDAVTDPYGRYPVTLPVLAATIETGGQLYDVLSHHAPGFYPSAAVLRVGNEDITPETVFVSGGVNWLVDMPVQVFDGDIPASKFVYALHSGETILPRGNATYYGGSRGKRVQSQRRGGSSHSRKRRPRSGKATRRRKASRTRRPPAKKSR